MSDLLEIGVSNEDVMDVQARLTFLGLYHGHCDGEFRSDLEDAVKAFQEHSTVEPTGTLDEHGLHYLRQYTDHHGYGHQHQEQHHQRHGHHQSHGHEVLSPQAEYEIMVGQNMTVDHVEYRDEKQVHGRNHGAYWSEMHQTLVNVERVAVDNARLNDEALGRALNDFREYAKRRVGEYQEYELTGEDVAKQVVRSCMDFAGIRLCSTIAPGVCKFAVEMISTFCARKASAMAQKGVHHASNGAELERELERLVHDLRAEFATLEHDVRASVAEQFHPLYLAIKDEQHLPAADDQWLAQCYGGDTTQLNEAVEQFLGIPQPARVPEIESAVYQRMVEHFEYGVAMVAERHRQNGQYLFTDRRTEGERFNDDPHRQARRAAAEAGAERDREHHIEHR